MIGGAAGTGRRQRTPLQTSHSTEVRFMRIKALSILEGSRVLEQRASAHTGCMRSYRVCRTSAAFCSAAFLWGPAASMNVHTSRGVLLQDL